MKSKYQFNNFEAISNIYFQSIDLICMVKWSDVSPLGGKIHGSYEFIMEDM